MPLPTPELEHVADLTVRVGSPIEAGQVQGLNSQGRRRIIPIIGGELLGPRLRGRILPGGADFQLIVSDRSTVLEARYLVELEDGEHLYVQNRALRRGSAQDIARLARVEEVDPAAIYFRCLPSFEVSAARHDWLLHSLFVGTGARFPDRVQLSFFRLS